ncbi:hypothetical protein EZV62_027732 [Acer yangbiense]|uniref:Uncharacterized protein n=1 Tax=Acer yangbiense TaxID=1000413 RepID=A0A5C7GUT8_9ROSI|nr:hypothetical protein EZV62_027732 [Acer yangbiense]
MVSICLNRNRSEFSGKRHREDGESEESCPKRRAKAQDSVAVETYGEETKATAKIADAIRYESNTEATKVAVDHVAANTIRLLIAGSQACCLVKNIEKLRNSSGAPNQLPALCESAHESDRVVQVSFCSNCLSLAVSMESSIISH